VPARRSLNYVNAAPRRGSAQRTGLCQSVTARRRAASCKRRGFDTRTRRPPGYGSLPRRKVVTRTEALENSALLGVRVT
jgi:hypothetical protein